MPDDITSIAAFSHTVGSIYDCALDPARWPDAIREICSATNCIAGVITVTNLESGACRLQQHWNYGPGWLERMVLYSPELAGLMRGVPDLHTRPLDQPFSAVRHM